MRTVNIRTLQDIESARPAEEGFPISSTGYEEYVEEELIRLSDAMEEWTSQHEEDGWYRGESPFYNSGYKFANDVFIACAYDWSEYETSVNFYYFAKQIDISWYKHAWRGTYGHNAQTLNAIENGELTHIIDDCIESLSNTDKNQFVWE